MIRAAALAILLVAAPSSAQDPAATLCGIDVLRGEDFATLAGQRIGLITNHTGTCRDGRSTVDVLLAAEGVQVVALFSPEHGFAGVLDAKVADSRHQGSGLPIHSLYGDSRRPTAEQLADLDTLVFDIQDIGCRFYTYVSTMGLAMRAAAEHGKRFVVLDRPDPIGGDLVEGPVRDAGGDDDDFVAFHTVPVRHGMTAGELAGMLRAEKGIDCDLHVVRMQGWDGRQPFDRTGLSWVNPSPNMRTLNAAYLYPAVGLLEFTNLSVGRGTDTPFELLGAPWIDGARLAAWLHEQRLPGVTFYPLRFTPEASKFAGEPCSGIRIEIVDRAAYRAMPLALALACGLRHLFPDGWQIERYRRLLRNDATFAGVRDGQPWRELLAAGAADLGAFLDRRRRFLLYGTR